MRRYRTDNGIYTSKEFMKEIYKENQGISHSGVGGHHHNGVAENNIKIIIRNARVMKIYASMRCPTCSDKSLCPMSVLHEVQLYNHIPRIGSNLSPLELWTKSKQSKSYLLNSHPWGCPVYVLDPRLQDGQKIPKWKLRSRVGQYVGY